MSRHLRPIALAAALLLAACSTLGYYTHSIQGGLHLLGRRRGIEKLLDDPTTPEPLRRQLALVLEIRDFAAAELLLPVDGSYRSYVDLDRPYAVWTVVAAEELSVEPVEWCFLFAGCVTYRGYFSEERAQRFAARLVGQGLDVDVAGVVAFSTLGWFADPVLSTFVHDPEAELAGLLFHELAHRRLWVKDDTTFNESFATAVELEGVGRWLEARRKTVELAAYRRAKRHDAQVASLVGDYRRRLSQAFAAERSDDWKRDRKRRLLEELRTDYLALRTTWDGDERWDTWFGDGLNNARLASLQAYHELVPAFQALLQQNQGDLARFYAAADSLVELSADERMGRLAAVAF